MYMDIWYYAYIWYILISGCLWFPKSALLVRGDEFQLSTSWLPSLHQISSPRRQEASFSGTCLATYYPRRDVSPVRDVIGFWHWSVTWGVKKLMENVLEFVEELHTRVRRVEQLGWKQHVLTFGVLPPNAVLCLDVRSRNPVQLEDIWYLGFAMGFWTFLHLCQIPRDVSFAKDIAALPLQLLWGKQGHLGCKNSHLLFERPNFRLENLWEWITKLATVHVDCLSNASPQSCRVFLVGTLGLIRKDLPKSTKALCRWKAMRVRKRRVGFHFVLMTLVHNIQNATWPWQWQAVLFGHMWQVYTNLINFWACLVFFHVFPS